MKTGTVSLELLTRVTHPRKRAFPSASLFPIAPIHEWAVFIEREKVLQYLGGRKRAKPRKTIQVQQISLTLQREKDEAIFLR